MALRQFTSGQDRLIYAELLRQAGADVRDVYDEVTDAWTIRADRGEKRVEVHKDGWGLRWAAFRRICEIWRSDPGAYKARMIEWLKSDA